MKRTSIRAGTDNSLTNFHCKGKRKAGKQLEAKNRVKGLPSFFFFKLRITRACMNAQVSHQEEETGSKRR